MFNLKNKFKLIFFFELLLLFFFIKKVNTNHKINKCTVKIKNDRYGFLTDDFFKKYVESIEGHEVGFNDFEECKKNLEETNLFKTVSFLKKKHNVDINVTCRDIIGRVCYHEENGIKNDDAYVLEDGSIARLKLREKAKLILIINDGKRCDFVDVLNILNYINTNRELKSVINTIYFDEKNMEVSTIYNDCIIRFDDIKGKDVLVRLKEMYKILFLSNNHNFLNFSNGIVVVDKSKVKKYVS